MNEDYSSDLPPQSNVVVGLQKCHICGIVQMEALENHLYCKNCYQHMEQAYDWLQSSLLSDTEKDELRQRMLDLTDIQKIQFD